MNDPLQDALEKAERQVRFANRFLPPSKREEKLRENLSYLQDQETVEDTLDFGNRALSNVPRMWWNAVLSSPVDAFVLTAGHINRFDIQLEHQSRFHKGGVLALYFLALYSTSSNLLQGVGNLALFILHLLQGADVNPDLYAFSVHMIIGIVLLAALMLQAQVLKLQEQECTLFQMMNRLEPKKTPRGLTHLDRVLGWTAMVAKGFSHFLFGLFTRRHDETVIQRIKDQFKPH